MITGAIPWQGSLRARLGLPVGNSLFYATGGLAVGQIDASYYCSSGCGRPRLKSYSTTRVGWTLGAGIEHAFHGSNWIGRVEYRYTDFGSATHVTPNWSGTFGQTESVTEHAVRFALSYKF